MMFCDQKPTEQPNPDTVNLDRMSTTELIEAINREDQKVANLIYQEIHAIATAVDLIVQQFSQGGRLIYIGAGTSGRLGVLDAAECPPTYGVSNQMVQACIAGGEQAMFCAVEGAEDNSDAGTQDLIERNIGKKDVICGIAASGETPYVIGALAYAKSLNIPTIAITMNPNAKLLDYANCAIVVPVGPEVVMGSTRMKAGTAQKMVLNMLSTAAMVKLGKVYGNLMVDLKASNKKLITRAQRIVMLAAHCDANTAAKILTATDYQVKPAIVMLLANVDITTAKHMLENVDGHINKALKAYNG